MPIFNKDVIAMTTKNTFFQKEVYHRRQLPDRHDEHRAWR